jgi:hypothetical protein
VHTFRQLSAVAVKWRSQIAALFDRKVDSAGGLYAPVACSIITVLEGILILTPYFPKSQAFKPNSRNAWLFEEYLIEQIKARSSGTQAVSNEAQAQQVLNRASGGNWSKMTGRNDALIAGTNSQGAAVPPIPPRPEVV